MLTNDSFLFLSELAENNHKPWFEANRKRYETLLTETKQLAVACYEAYQAVHPLPEQKPEKSLVRIYRDVRFSKDKSPYNPRMGISLTTSTLKDGAGIYLHIQPGASFWGAGIYQPEPQPLSLIREDIDFDGDTWQEIVQAPDFVKEFGTLGGDRLKKAPKGYEPTHQHIELLKHKGYIVSRNLSDKEILSASLPNQLANTFKTALPLLLRLNQAVGFEAE